jgi:hypothetical protein
VVWLLRMPRITIYCLGASSCVLVVVLLLNFVHFTAVVNRDVAWSHLSAMSSFGPGNSRANSLYWTATRAASLPGFNATSTRPAPVQGPAACSANSACDAIGTQSVLFFRCLKQIAIDTHSLSSAGMLGECCPTPNGMRLGCCPHLDV